MSSVAAGSGNEKKKVTKNTDDGSSAGGSSGEFPVQVKLEVTEEASEPLQERGTPFFNFSDVSMVSGFMQNYPGLSDYVLTNAQYHATQHHGPGRKKKPPNVPLPMIPGSYRTGPKHRKDFPCERCNQVFEKREELRIHVMMHAGEKPFECRVCKKTFARKANLMEHEISHSGVRPYICNLCAKSFSSCTDLMNHRLLHSGLKPHVCNMCGQGFTEMAHLRAHKEIMHGTPHYRCSCGMGFSHIAELIKHKKDHPQEGEYPCQYCGKTFSEQAALIVHKRVHMEDKGFVCNSCGEKFEKAGPLIQHRKKVCREKAANAAIAQLQNAANSLSPPPAVLVATNSAGPSHQQQMDSCVDVTMNSDAPAQKSDAGSENENLGLLKASAINADDANSAPEEKPRLSAVIRPVRKSLWTPQESILPISKTSAFTNSPRQSARKKTKKVFDDSVPVKISQSRGSNPTLVPVPSSPLHWDESRFNADVTIDEVELNPTAKMSTPLLHGSEVTEESLEYQIGDLVWASVNSFPYWPAIVCQEYATNTHYQVKAQGMYSKLLFHVMFLNDKNRHNWVSAGKIEPFVDEKTFEEWKTAKLNAAPKGRSKRFWMKLFTISPTIRRAYKVAVEIGERLMPRPRALRCQELLVPNSVDEKTFDSFVAEPEPFPEPEVKLKDESSRSSTKEPRSLFPKFEKRKEKLCAKCFKFIPEPDENLDIKVAEQGIECSGGCGKSYHRLCYMNINATKNQLSAQFRRSKKKSDVKSEVDAKLLTMKTATCPECESDLKQCFICKALDKGLQQCVHKNCRKHYHNSCVGHSKWHQSVVQNGKLTCPLHKCHTCASLGENAKALDRPHKLIQCVLCPTAYHYDIECSPAGTYYIGGNYMICPKVHGKKLTHANCSVCLLCSKGGMLICCDACPSAVHAACLPYEFDTEASFLCEFCEFGKMPLYRDIVWAKIAHFRFWPAIIVDPEEIPLNVLRLPYEPGQFPVMFFGTHQYSWVDRTRVFWYEEDDWKFALNSVGKGKGQTKDQQFKDAINEAKLAYDSRLEADKIQLEEAVAKPRTKPPPYVKIKGNKPFGRVKAVDFNVSNCQTCNCDPSSEDPCGPTSNCLNRHVLYECHASLCPAGEKCRNQCFQRREYPQLAPFPTGEKGWGLKSLELIKKGSFVIEYVGELIDNAEYETRMAWKHKTMDKHYYFLTLDSNRIIDAGPKGNLARFMNHSCEPNCVTQKWSVAGDDRVGLFALRDIQPGEELTFNYNLESVCKSQMKVCECKAPGCVGHIGMKVAVKPDEEEIVNEPPKKKRRLTKTGSLRKPLSGCYYCGKILDELIPCKTCPRTYHEECVKRNGGQLPRDNNWLCPWHFCAEPDCKTVVFTNRGPNGSLAVCDHCPTSYCIAHKDPKKMTWLGRLGYVCHRHSKVSIEKLVNFLTPEYVFADCMNATPIAKKSK